jgi:putative membrane protein
MYLIANVLIALIAVEHVYILTMEMFLWQTPRGLKAFNNTPEKAAITAVMAKNQGLYNGFLAAGLIYGLLASSPVEAYHFKIFFSACVFVAGAYAGVTASRKIFFGQGVPGLAALVTVLLAGPR